MGYGKEKGEVMIESLYCMFAVIVVFFMMFAFGFFIYQHVIFEIVTNEVAEEIIQVYKFKDAKNDYDIDSKDIEGIKHFRYVFGSGSYNRSAEKRIKAIAVDRLKATSFAVGDDLSVKVDCETDGIGRRHYIVTLSQTYSYFLGGLLKYIGQDAKSEIVASTCIESMDISHYINTVRFGGYLCDKVSDIADTVGLSSIWDSAVKALNTVSEMFKGDETES